MIQAGSLPWRSCDVGWRRGSGTPAQSHDARRTTQYYLRVTRCQPPPLPPPSNRPSRVSLIYSPLLAALPKLQLCPAACASVLLRPAASPQRPRSVLLRLSPPQYVLLHLPVLRGRAQALPPMPRRLCLMTPRPGASLVSRWKVTWAHEMRRHVGFSSIVWFRFALPTICREKAQMGETSGCVQLHK